MSESKEKSATHREAVSEAAWAKWQATYAVVRNEAFAQILEEIRKKKIQGKTMTRTVIISNFRNCYIELTNSDADPGMWIVRRYKKTLGMKSCISSDWFTSEDQATQFAKKMKQEFKFN